MISTLQVDRRPEIWKFEKKKNRARSDNTFDATTKNVLHQKQIFNSLKNSFNCVISGPFVEKFNQNNLNNLSLSPIIYREDISHFQLDL